MQPAAANEVRRFSVLANMQKVAAKMHSLS